MTNLAGAVCATVWLIYFTRAAFDKNWRQRKIEALQGETFLHYRQGLRNGLVWLSRLIGDDNAPRPLAWSAQSYFVCLGLAVFYPLYFMIGTWALAHGPGRYASLVFLPDDAPEWKRLMLLFLPVIVAVSAYSTLRLLRFWRSFDGAIWIGIQISALFVAGALALFGAFTGVYAIAFVLTFFSAFAVFCAGTLDTDGNERATTVFVFVLPFVVAITLAFATAFADQFAFIYAFLGAGYITGSVVLAGALAGIYADRRAKGGGLVLLFALIAPVTAFCLSGFDGHLSINLYHVHKYIGEAAPLVVFFALLPAVNASMDWVSLGFTRRIVGWIAGQSTEGIDYLEKGLGGYLEAVLILVNIVLALLLAGLVVLTTIAGVALFDRLHVLSGHVIGGDAHFYNVARTIRDIAADPSDRQYWWLYGMMFWTLVPTLFHTVSFIRAVIANNTKGSVGRFLAARLGSRNPLTRVVVAPIALTAFDVIGVPLFLAFPLIAAWSLVRWAFPRLDFSGATGAAAKLIYDTSLVIADTIATASYADILIRAGGLLTLALVLAVFAFRKKDSSAPVAD
jgi:hypothetical protein